MTRAALASFALLLCVAVPGRAEGMWEVFGADAASKALANARTATGGGATAPHYNPAAMTQTHGMGGRVDFALSLPAARFEFATPPDASRAPRPLRSYAGWNMAATFELGGILEDRVWVGAAMFQPAFTFTHASAPDPSVPYVYRYQTAPDTLQATPAIAVKFLDWLSMGFALRMGGGQVGRLDMAVDPLTGTVTEQSIEAEQIPYQTPAGGVLLGPIGWDVARFSFGFAYREHTAFPMGVVSHLLVEGIDLDFVMPVNMITNWSPRTFNLGAAVTLFEDLDVALDLTYAVWSEAPSPYLNFELYAQGEGIEELGLLGSLDTPSAGRSRVRPAGFVDTLEPRIGVEYRPLDDLLAVRGGYSYRPTPVPDQTSGTNIGDANTHIVALGAGLTTPLPFFEHPVSVDASWQTHIFEPRRTQKGAGDDPVGSWTLLGTMSELSVGAGYYW
jgi:long-subunit fatty acid transport protein